MLLLSFSGCTLLPTATNSQNEIEIAQVESIPMAKPLGPARRIVQQIRASWPGREETLLCVLELDEHRIAIAGLSKDGISLFNISYDGNKVEMTKSPLLPEYFSPS